MRITVQQLRRVNSNIHSANAEEFVKVFNEWSDRFGINTPLRIAHFLSQLMWESGAFNYVEENLNYSAKGLLKMWPNRFNNTTAAQYARKPEKIANRVYANRMGNGNEASGDGWRYRGRGFIQCTGKETYLAYKNSGFCVGDLMAHPEWLAKSPGHTKSAMWYWWKRGLNALADKDNGMNTSEIFHAITYRINQACDHEADRKYYMRRFKKEFGT